MIVQVFPCLVLLVKLVLLSVLLPSATGSYHCSNNATQNSYLWRIEASPPIYLFGTMHVPYKKLWDDVPDNVKSVLSLSEHLCVELRLTDSETSKNLSACRYLPKNETLESVLPGGLYVRVLKYFVRIQNQFPKWLFGNASINGLSRIESDRLFHAMIGNWNRLRPVWLLMLISSLSRENVQERSIPLLDVFLDRAAEGMGKNVEAVEVYKEQCRPFNRLNNTKVFVALRKLLDYLEPLADGPISSTDSDLETYNCGDFKSLVSARPILPLPSSSKLPNLTSEEAGDLESINEFLVSQIVYRRNRRMSKTIMSLLSRQRNETYLFAIGAGHFVGERNVVHMLKKKGYSVNRLSVTETIPGPPLPKNIISLGDPSSQLTILNISSTIPTLPPNRPSHVPPTLSPETIARIIQSVFNNTQSIYTVDSVEVTPTTTSLNSATASTTVATPTSSVTPPTSSSSQTRSLTISDSQRTSDDSAFIPSASSGLRYNIGLVCVTLFFVLLIITSAL
ncbi:PREDICTED: metalloprotease TIKI homolog isoform X1 [Amphimedon queenslandica]|uniref:Metalloprotease TIKI homolog n=1 Tax=Amphimedon queenslandica TaxID=400682 RepID=A0AAN0J7T7_AMPQE|nr:PREDICTED: metalloprotease TIKI homolog isoform X1 [Amphimedon queenslandica]|eukprot:XP_019852812.1 PREDICTED: metalloprotease TIKI homolog isoform X1 [Amphimedon queenslandica]